MIRPLRDVLFLRPSTEALGMVGLIHMPEISKLSCKTTAVCEVVAAGPKARDVKVGSKVRVEVYDKHYAGDEAVVEGEKLIVIRERDIVGIELAS
jgi:co-chaperonin GroES (HSP10)